MFKPLAVACTFAGLSLPFAWPATAQDQPPVAPAAEPAAPTVSDGQGLIQEEKFDEAAEVFRKIVAARPDNAQAWHLLGYSLHAGGHIDEALPMHLMAAEFPQNRGVSAYNVACVYALRNNKDRAFAWLNKARDQGFRNPGQIEGDSDMDNLRSDPRFEEFMQSLAQASPAAPGGIRDAVAPADGARREAGGGDAVDSGAPAAKTLSADDVAKLPAEQQMDFWLGEWSVTRAQGGPAAKNVISRDIGGQVVREVYTAEGFTGEAMYYYDAAEKHWVQFWVDSQGVAVLTYGSFHDGAMHGEGRRVRGDGAEVLTRFALTPNADGTLRQFIENSSDNGKTWSTYFDGMYRRTR